MRSGPSAAPGGDGIDEREIHRHAVPPLAALPVVRGMALARSRRRRRRGRDARRDRHPRTDGDGAPGRISGRDRLSRARRRGGRLRRVRGQPPPVGRRGLDDRADLRRGAGAAGDERLAALRRRCGGARARRRPDSRGSPASFASASSPISCRSRSPLGSSPESPATSSSARRRRCSASRRRRGLWSRRSSRSPLGSARRIGPRSASASACSRSCWRANGSIRAFPAR